MLEPLYIDNEEGTPIVVRGPNGRAEVLHVPRAEANVLTLFNVYGEQLVDAYAYGTGATVDMLDERRRRVSIEIRPGSDIRIKILDDNEQAIHEIRPDASSPFGFRIIRSADQN